MLRVVLPVARGGLLGAVGGVRLERDVVEQPVDHRHDHLDVGQLLGADGQEHVLVLAGQPAVPALQQVLGGDGHLAPLTAEDLLHLAGEVRVGTVGLGLVLQGVGVREHADSLVRRRAAADAVTSGI